MGYLQLKESLYYCFKIGIGPSKLGERCNSKPQCRLCLSHEYYAQLLPNPWRVERGGRGGGREKEGVVVLQIRECKQFNFFVITLKLAVSGVSV